jgi:hypothetical protein
MVIISPSSVFDGSLVIGGSPFSYLFYEFKFFPIECRVDVSFPETATSFQLGLSVIGHLLTYQHVKFRNG